MFAQTKQQRSAALDSPSPRLSHHFMRAAGPVIFSRRIQWRSGTGLTPSIASPHLQQERLLFAAGTRYLSLSFGGFGGH
jgi:hypothetical protein